PWPSGGFWAHGRRSAMWWKRVGNNRLGAAEPALAALCVASALPCSEARDGGGRGAAGAGEPATESLAVSPGQPTTDGLPVASVRGPRGEFVLEEATITDIQQAIVDRTITATELVTRYLQRIK